MRWERKGWESMLALASELPEWRVGPVRQLPHCKRTGCAILGRARRMRKSGTTHRLSSEIRELRPPRVASPTLWTTPRTEPCEVGRRLNVAERGQDSFPEAEKGVRTRGPGARLKSSSFPMRNGPGNASPSGLGLAPVRFLIVSPTARSPECPPGPSDPGSAAGWSCRPSQGFWVGHGGRAPIQELAESVHLEPVGQAVLVVIRVLATEQRRGVADRKRKGQALFVARCPGGARGCGLAIPPRRLGPASAARCVFLGGVGYVGKPVRGHGRPPARAWTRCRLRDRMSTSSGLRLHESSVCYGGNGANAATTWPRGV